MYICTYQDWFFGWSQTFFYWKRKSTEITNLKSKILLQQRLTSLTCTFLSFFLLLFDDSPFLLCLPSIFGWLLLGAFSTGLACITIFISYFNSFLFASLTFGASSTITLLWSTSWLASLPQSLSSSAILDFLSPGKNKNKLQQILKTNHLFHQIEKSYCCYIHVAGSEIAPSRSPMRLEIQSWWPEFHSWSPASDL